MTLAQFFLINFGALIAAAGGLFLKRLSSSLGDPAMNLNWFGSVFFNLNLWAGGVCYVLPIILWTYLLRSMDLTKLQPLLAVGYLYTIALAYLFLEEQLSMQRLTGIAIIIVGVIIVSRT